MPSIEDYEWSKSPAVIDGPFYGILMAAMRRADSGNAERLRKAFPAVWIELQARYRAPGGRLPKDDHPPTIRVVEDSWR